MFLRFASFVRGRDRQLVRSRLAQVMATPKRLCVARRAAGPSAGCDWLLSPAFVEHAELLDARELAALAMTARSHRRASEDFVGAALARRHGLRVAQGAVADLHAFDSMPVDFTVDLRASGAREVVSGSPLHSVCVGGRSSQKTLAQLPPAQGDRWCLGVWLQRGRYALTVDGWENPAHGVLDISLDGRPAAAFDYCGPRTVRCSHRADVSVRWTGPHRLVGSCDRTSADLDRATRHWICLRRLRLHRVAPLQSTK